MASYRTLLADAPQAVCDAFKDYIEGRLTWSELGRHIDDLGLTDPAIRTFREAKLAALDADEVIGFI